jgi:hypothetical protein
MFIQSLLAKRLPRTMLLAAAMLAAASLASPAQAEAEPGTWQAHETELVYMGFTTTYSCDGLEEKLKLLLRQLGARSDAKVIGFGCDRGYGTPSRFARATLKFATLQPLSAGAPASSSAPGADALVDGSWRQVDLAPHHPFGLQDGDCELMEQFRDKVLPLFSTRALQSRTQCVPHQDTGGNFGLQLQVFAPVPAPKSK